MSDVGQSISIPTADKFQESPVLPSNSNRFRFRSLVLGFLIIGTMTLALISVSLLAVIVSSSPFTAKKALFLPINISNICDVVENCQAPNEDTPYYRLLVPSLGDNARGISRGTSTSELDHYMGVHPIKPNEGMIVWGEIPDGIYFAFVLYLWDVPYDGPGTNSEGRKFVWSSAADPVSYNRGDGGCNYFAWIFSPNQNMVASIERWFLSRWNSVKNPVRIMSSLIPQFDYNPMYRYQVLARYFPRDSTLPLPTFSAAWCSDTSVVTQILPLGIPPVPRGTQPDEHKIPGADKWRELCRSVVAAKYNIEVEGFIRIPYMAQVIPGGLNFGWQCSERFINCEADSRDTIYYTQWNIITNPNQAIVTCALNHHATGTAVKYSNINIYDQASQTSYDAVITGIQGEQPEINIPPQDLSAGIVLIYSTPPDSIYDPSTGLATSASSERCYVSETGVGPRYDIILPAVTFVVTREGVTPPSTPPQVLEASASNPPEAVAPAPENAWGLAALLRGF